MPGLPTHLVQELYVSTVLISTGTLYDTKYCFYTFLNFFHSETHSIIIHLDMFVFFQCRNKVDRINKNHIVNNLVEAYFKEHPEKRRAEGDIKELEAKNKITKDMVGYLRMIYTGRVRRRSVFLNQLIAKIFQTI